jgi:hypothetical protein
MEITKPRKPLPGEIESLIADRVINQIIIIQEEEAKEQPEVHVIKDWRG